MLTVAKFREKHIDSNPYQTWSSAREDSVDKDKTKQIFLLFKML